MVRGGGASIGDSLTEDGPELLGGARARRDLDSILEMAVRAPTAGNTAGREFIVLEGPETARYWESTTTLGVAKYRPGAGEASSVPRW